MQITFDNLDELKAFFRTFKLDEKAAATPKPKLKMEAARANAKTVKEASTPKIKAIKSKGKSNTSQPGSNKQTLTAQIQKAIHRFLDEKSSFTASDVYDRLAKKDKSIKKQSVVTSVLKQMNTAFSEVKVKKQPGKGPRPVKVYNP